MHPRPRLFVSSCLGFERCRYNGQAIDDGFVSKTRKVCDVVTACPEVDTGLGVPRDPVHLVMKGGVARMLQPAFGLDHTEAMHAFGGLSEGLSPAEHKLFIDTIDEYRDERIPASTMYALLRSWAVRFGVDYLLGQTFLDPYPGELVEVNDSGKGRDR